MKIVERIKEFIKQKACGHKEFENIQIRTLQCKRCGMRARLRLLHISTSDNGTYMSTMWIYTRKSDETNM